MTKYEDDDGEGEGEDQSLSTLQIALLNNLGIEEEEEAMSLIPTLKEKYEHEPDKLKQVRSTLLLSGVGGIW